MKSEIERAKERLERSQELANQVKAGTYIEPMIDTMESFFPVRPAVKKDVKEIARIYSKTPATPDNG